jgi:hypothetical protein
VFLERTQPHLMLGATIHAAEIADQLLADRQALPPTVREKNSLPLPNGPYLCFYAERAVVRG